MKKLLFLVLLFITACASESCNTNKCSTTHVIRKPVEVIYENTTYTTVYEPKTYKTITYEKKPYNKCEMCY